MPSVLLSTSDDIPLEAIENLNVPPTQVTIFHTQRDNTSVPILDLFQRNMDMSQLSQRSNSHHFSSKRSVGSTMPLSQGSNGASQFPVASASEINVTHITIQSGATFNNYMSPPRNNMR